MKKRLCSLLLTMAMLVSLFPVMSASAAEEITTGWTIQEFKNGSTNASCTVEVADGNGVGYNSNRAIYINWTAGNNGSDWLNIENDGIKSYTASDRYTVSFRIKKVDTTGSYPDILFGWTGGKDRLESKYPECYTIGEADANGWQLVTATTSVDAKRYFQLNIQKPTFEAYIDDFVVTKNGDPTNLLVNGDFESGAAVTVPTHTALSALEDWTASYRSSYPETAGTREVKTATGVFYTGKKSMYAKFDGSGSNWVEIKNSNMTAALDSSKTYDVSFYITGTYTATGNEFSVKMGNTFADKSDTPNAYAAKSMTFEDPEDSAKVAEGWKKVSVTLKNPDSAFLFVIQGVCEAYIDDFSVVETGTTTNLLANPGFEGTTEEWTPIYPIVSAPTRTAVLDGWTTAPGGSVTPTTSTFIASVGAENAYSGEKSLYVEYTATPDYNNSWVSLKNTGTLFSSLDASKVYTVSMYVKGNKLGCANLMMGYKYDDKNEDNETNNWMLSRMSATEPEDAAKAADGWRKYTVTLYGPTTDFAINIQCESKVYIDDVSVVEVGTTANLIVNPGFEDGVVIQTHTALSALEDWNVYYRSSYPETSGTREVKTATGVSYTGKKSMYAKFDGSGSNWVEIKNSNLTAALDNSKTYDVSFYIRGTYTATGNEFSVKMGNTFADKSDAPNAYAAKSMTFEDPEDSAKAAEGWKKVSVTLKNPDSAFLFVIQGVCEAYIDDFSVVETGTTTNLLANPGFEGSAAGIPDITEAALNSEKWKVVAGNKGASSYTAAVTSMEAQQGKKSLHLKWTSSNGDEYVQIQAQGVKALLTEGENYTLEVYVKRVSGNASVVGGWYGWGGQSVGNATEGEWSVVTASGNYTTKSAETVQVVLQGTQGIDMYIDSMVLKNANEDVIWSENFETTDTGYETSAIKLFDEDMNEINTLSSDLDGKNLTAAVAVTNYDKANLTGQLLLALYDGYQLKELIMSDVKNVTTTASGAQMVTVEFELPDYKDSYTMKAFIWDSIEGMNPLSRDVVEF